MERYELGKGTALGLLHRAGVAVRCQGLSPVDLPRAIALYESGLSCVRLAGQFGCDAETVRKGLRSARVEMRRPWARGARLRLDSRDSGA